MPTLISPSNMTADNAPSPYVASASSEYPGEAAWEAFDGVLTNYWLGNSGLPAWLAIDLGTAQVVGSYSIQADSVNALPLSAMPASWTLQGSNDGTTWLIVDAQDGQPAWASSELRTFTCHVETAAYRYFRVYITVNQGSGTYVQIPSLCLYQGTASGTTPADFAPHNLTSDTSHTPYVVSASGSTGGYNEWNAFTGDTSGAEPWAAVVPAWLQLDTGAGNAYTLEFYTIWTGIGSGYAPTAWTMEGSNDGATWTTLDTQTGQTAWGNDFTYRVTGAAAYRYFRLNITANNGATAAAVDGLYLYGTSGTPPPPPPPAQRGNIAYDQIKASDRTGNGDQLLTWNSTVPATAGAAGNAGQMAYDSRICICAYSWLRTTFVTW